MAFEEKLKNFIKMYEDMEKKVAQDDLFNKEFMVLPIEFWRHLVTTHLLALLRCLSLVRYSGKMRVNILQTLGAYPLTVKKIGSKIFYLVSQCSYTTRSQNKSNSIPIDTMV